MKHLSLLAVGLTILAIGCGSKSPTSATSNPNLVKFSMALLPSNEVPAVTNADAGGSGHVDIAFNITRDAAGAITSATADFTVQLAGFPAGPTLVGAHIHHAPAGQVAGVLVSTGIGNGEITLPTGSTSFTRTGVTNNMSPDNVLDMVNNPQNYYFNVHSTINTGGCARGQLVKQ